MMRLAAAVLVDFETLRRSVKAIEATISIFSLCRLR